jgi:LmbE family N-acetylglucosaminyl deacetylase
VKILAFGSHPDDIEIGVGGTLAKALREGHDIMGIVMTLPKDTTVRRAESEIAAEILGIGIKLLNMKFDDLFFSRKLVKKIDDILYEHNPDIIFTHWNGDSHQDHNVLTSGVIAASRMNECSVYMYEQTLPGGIVPDLFNAQMYVDISDTIEKKIKSIEAHRSQQEISGEFWLHGIKGRAMFRGSQINVKYAEAFQVVKELWLR